LVTKIFVDSSQVTVKRGSVCGYRYSVRYNMVEAHDGHYNGANVSEHSDEFSDILEKIVFKKQRNKSQTLRVVAVCCHYRLERRVGLDTSLCPVAPIAAA
jgi:hypothetical protein